jgi:hypothetical protein
MNTKLLRLAALGFFFAGTAPTGVRAQVFERDTTITGPRGNSVSRDIRVERNGPMVDRQVTIRRPGGTITRNTEIFAPRGGPHFGPRPYWGGGGFVAGPAFFGPPLAVGVGLPAVNLFVGGGGPAVAAPPPVTVYNPPVPYPLSTAAANGTPAQPATPQPLPGQPTTVVDPVAESIGKLSSIHSHTRREAAITLGKYGDARGVPPLIDKLEHDFDKEVRMAAAWALAEIGDPRAEVPLETARQFDKRADVRAVAAKSLERMPREAPAEAQAPAPRRSQTSAGDAYGYPSRRTPATSSPNRGATSTPGAATDLEPLPQYTPSTPSSDDIPPPDPTPSSRATSPR